MYVGASTPHETIMGAGRRRAQDRAGGTADRQRLREQKRVSLLSEINGFAADTTCDTLMVRKLPTSCVQPPSCYGTRAADATWGRGGGRSSTPVAGSNPVAEFLGGVTATPTAMAPTATPGLFKVRLGLALTLTTTLTLALTLTLTLTLP